MHAEGKATLNDKNELRYKIPTSGGQDGGPIILHKGGEPYVVGLHSSSCEAESRKYKKGVYLDERIHTTLILWLAR